MWEGEGCKECRDTGYKGRSGMDMNDRLKTLVTGSVELVTIADAARKEGLVTLREIAINKMLEGVTTYG